METLIKINTIKSIVFIIVVIILLLSCPDGKLVDHNKTCVITEIKCSESKDFSFSPYYEYTTSCDSFIFTTRKELCIGDTIYITDGK